MLAGAVGVIGGAIVATTTSSGRSAGRKLRDGSHQAIGRIVAEERLGSPISPPRRRKRSVPNRLLGMRESSPPHVGRAAVKANLAVGQTQEPVPAAPSVATTGVVAGVRERVEFGFER